MAKQVLVVVLLCGGLTAQASPRVAEYEPLFGAPLCNAIGSSCDTGTLIAGVGSYEPNSPNTIDSCADQSASVYQQDESIDRIVVKAKDGGTMTAGTTLEIQATVSTAVDVSTRSNPGHSETAHMYYHSQSTSTWKYICTKMTPPGSGSVTFSCDFVIPEDNYFASCGSSCGLQIVRVNYGYGEYAVEACTEVGLWDVQYSDVDDLVFLVAPAPTPNPSPMPSLEDSSPPSKRPSLNPSAGASQTPSASASPSSTPSSMAEEPTSIPSKPASVSPSIAPSTSTNHPSSNPTPSPEASDFYFVCAANFIDALSHCTQNKLCPTGTECGGGDICFPIHCTDCPEIPCHQPTPSPTKQIKQPSSVMMQSPSTNPSQSPSAYLPTLSPLQVNSRSPSASPLASTGRPTVPMNSHFPSSFPTEAPTEPSTLKGSAINSSSIAPSSPPSSNSSQANHAIASHDPEVNAPRCFTLASSCISGDLLKGVGRFERHAPNTVDQCKGDSSNLTSSWQHDECVDRIIVRTTNGETMAADSELEVEVTLSSANDASKRSLPNKWSVAHVYYSPLISEDFPWVFLKSFVVEPGSGENVFKVRFFPSTLDFSDEERDLAISAQSRGSHSSVLRVSYGYAQYEKSPCASDGMEDPSYLDVDDLIFAVTATTDKPTAPTAMPSGMTSDASTKVVHACEAVGRRWSPPLPLSQLTHRKFHAITSFVDWLNRLALSRHHMSRRINSGLIFLLLGDADVRR